MHPMKTPTTTMNNHQFRRLLVDQSDRKNEGSQRGKVEATPSTLGAKKSSFMPMTPRTVKGGIDVDFARQVRERNAALQPKKKFKAVAPKGAKYGAGYTDRAKARAEAEAEDGGDGDDKASRIQALEEQMKLGQIPVETFEALREEITGGDVRSTHLVKGLDRKLLERVRRGEDVLGTGSNAGITDSDEMSPDVDDELDKLGEKDVEAVKRKKVEKTGTMAPPPPVAGVKRSRDEIMVELKAQRRRAAAEAKAAAPVHFDSSRWRKVGEKQMSRIEVDRKGRQVLITVDEDGVVKRKVRKAGPGIQEQEMDVLDMPDASKPVLGADAVVPEIRKSVDVQREEGDDDDIFEGVGTEYNPLGNDNEEDESEEDTSDEEGEGEAEEETPRRHSKPAPPQPVEDKFDNDDQEEDSEDDVPLEDEKPPAVGAAPRNYFKDSAPSNDPTESIDQKDRLAGVQDLLKKAARMDAAHADDNEDENESEEDRRARLQKRARMLAQHDRDLVDMDMGFGGSRFDDDGEEDVKMKLSEWKGSSAGGGDDVWEEDADRGKKEKKRKPKKRKGDANSATDIMRVIEGRKAGGNGH